MTGSKAVTQFSHARCYVNTTEKDRANAITGIEKLEKRTWTWVVKDGMISMLCTSQWSDK